MTKERPILFSAPMVRAILDGRKTQTRRVMKPGLGDWSHPCKYGRPGDRLWVKETFRFTSDFDGDSPSRVGERCIDAGYPTPWAPINYDADGERRNWRWVGTPPARDVTPGKTRVSIHMPRWASRITLEIVGTRIERLNDCRAGDAAAEGLIAAHGGWSGAPDLPVLPSPIAAYASLWDSINGAGAWAANPYVWVVEFRRIEP